MVVLVQQYSTSALGALEGYSSNCVRWQLETTDVGEAIRFLRNRIIGTGVVATEISTLHRLTALHKCYKELNSYVVKNKERHCAQTGLWSDILQEYEFDVLDWLS